MHLDLQLSLPTAVTPSPSVLKVAAMFGLGIDRDRELRIIPPVRLELGPGQVVFVTGASGSGKSSLLRLIADALRNRDDAAVIPFDRPAPAEASDRPLVDCFGDLPLERVMQTLSYAGLNDAFVMLRKPAELSDGQRYRFRLAQAMAAAESHASAAPPALTVVLADEFGATLDRVTAAVIARNVRKWTRRRKTCFIAATTHDDLLEPLDPDVLIEKHLGETIEIVTRAQKPATSIKAAAT